MNRDELIAIAKEAGIWIPADADCETFITTIDELTKFAALIAEPLEDEIAKLKNENNFVETLYVLDDCECAGELETWEDSCDEGEIIDLMGYKVSESFNASFIKINGKLIPNEVKAQIDKAMTNKGEQNG